MLLTSVYYSRFQFDTINEICGVMLRQEPESEELISAALKECINRNVSDVLRCNILSEWGYGITDFSYMHPLYFAVIGFLAGTFLFVITFLLDVYKRQSFHGQSELITLL